MMVFISCKRLLTLSSEMDVVGDAIFSLSLFLFSSILEIKVSSFICSSILSFSFKKILRDWFPTKKFSLYGLIQIDTEEVLEAKLGVKKNILTTKSKNIYFIMKECFTNQEETRYKN